MDAQVTPNEDTVRAAEVARDVLNTPAEADRICLEHFLEAGKAGRLVLTEGQKAALSQLLEGSAKGIAAVTNALDVTSEEYTDTRGDDKQHAVARFELPISVEQNASVLLKELLGDNADGLIRDWGDRADFNVAASSENQAILFKYSNSKARNRDYDLACAETTQEEDFENARANHAPEGFQFADDVQATLICAALVKKAENIGLDLADIADSWDRSDFVDTGKLKGEEFDLLVKLLHGVVRTRSGAVGVDADGCLRACSYDSYDAARSWAFGGVVSSAELKT